MYKKTLLYIVEGKTEKKLVSAIKNRYIEPGRVEVINVVEKPIPKSIIRNLNHSTVVVLIFDTDTDYTKILEENIVLLKKQGSVVKEIILVLQVNNLEEELVFATNIKQIKELTKSKSNTDFKSDFIASNNCLKLLEDNGFDINKFWSRNVNNSFKKYSNNSCKVKIK